MHNGPGSGVAAHSSKKWSSVKQSERVLGRPVARELKLTVINQVGCANRGGIVGPSFDATYSGGAIYADHVPDTHAEPIETTTKFAKDF